MSAEINLGSLTGPRTINNFVGNFTGGVDSRDTFAFTLSSTQNLDISLSNLTNNADLRLFRARNLDDSLEPIEEIARSTNGSNLNELISRVLGPGIYIAEVSRANNTVSTNYTLRFTPNNAANVFNVGTLNAPQTFSGAVGNTNPNDIYQFTLSTTSNLNLRLNGLSQDADVVLAFDSNRNGVIDSGEQIGISQLLGKDSESINLQSLQAGDYLAQVYRFQNSNTHYRLHLDATATDSPLSNVDLVGQFGTVRVPDIRLANDGGQAQIIVSSQGFLPSNTPVTVRLYASTDGTLDSNDELLGSQTLNLNLFSGQSQVFNFKFDNPTVVAPGSYRLIAQIDANNAVVESNERNNIAALQVSAPGTDVVLDWNATLLNAIQSFEIPPPLAARTQAMVHAAIYDAVNAIDRTHVAYLVNLNSGILSASNTVGASITAAAAAAAHRILVTLYADPQYAALRAEFDAQLVRSLAEVPNGFAETRGIDIGRFVADQILATRSNDGSANAQATYNPRNQPGSYQPTHIDGFVALPNWGQVRPFAINPLALDGPPIFGSTQYAIELNQTQAVGGFNSQVRTADQTEVAIFWAYDRPDTFRPPGQWNQIAETVALQAGTSVVTNARLFALLNIAQADAGISAWNAKYTHHQLRPITAIHQADLDGHSQTVGDPNWQSLLPTPPFPDYVSGHSSFGAAAASVLASFFGDFHPFTVYSQEIPGVSRSYSSFQQAADENGISRIYGGVHVQSANQDGLLTGYTIGNQVVQNLLT
jgi:membrane-associated phospholipid phosphatase